MGLLKLVIVIVVIHADVASTMFGLPNEYHKTLISEPEVLYGAIMDGIVIALHANLALNFRFIHRVG